MPVVGCMPSASMRSYTAIALSGCPLRLHAVMIVLYVRVSGFVPCARSVNDVLLLTLSPSEAVQELQLCARGHWKFAYFTEPSRNHAQSWQVLAAMHLHSDACEGVRLCWLWPASTVAQPLHCTKQLSHTSLSRGLGALTGHHAWAQCPGMPQAVTPQTLAEAHLRLQRVKHGHCTCQAPVMEYTSISALTVTRLGPQDLHPG